MLEQPDPSLVVQQVVGQAPVDRAISVLEAAGWTKQQASSIALSGTPVESFIRVAMVRDPDHEVVRRHAERCRDYLATNPPKNGFQADMSVDKVLTRLMVPTRNTTLALRLAEVLPPGSFD